jgi:hypothetical protein
MRFFKETRDTVIALTKLKFVLKFDLIGSVLIDPDNAKDLDFLVLADGPGFCEVRHLFGNDWSLCAGKYDDQTDKWGTLRNGDVNLIVTTDDGWYQRAQLANTVCVALKLKDKGDRIVTYRVIRDGYSAAGANLRRDGSA